MKSGESTAPARSIFAGIARIFVKRPAVCESAALNARATSLSTWYFWYFPFSNTAISLSFNGVFTARKIVATLFGKRMLSSGMYSVFSISLTRVSTVVRESVVVLPPEAFPSNRDTICSDSPLLNPRADNASSTRSRTIFPCLVCGSPLSPPSFPFLIPSIAASSRPVPSTFVSGW
jgi:hypothetical protein